MSTNNIKIINIKSMKPSESFGGGPAQGEDSELDDFLDDVSNSQSHAQDIDFFNESKSQNHSDGGDIGYEKDEELEDDNFSFHDDEEPIVEPEEESKQKLEEFKSQGGESIKSDEDDELEEDELEEEEQEGGAKSIGDRDSVVEELSGDPMFLVLSHFMTSRSGKNMVDILESINENLAKLSVKK